MELPRKARTETEEPKTTAQSANCKSKGLPRKRELQTQRSSKETATERRSRSSTAEPMTKRPDFQWLVQSVHKFSKMKSIKEGKRRSKERFRARRELQGTTPAHWSKDFKKEGTGKSAGFTPSSASINGFKESLGSSQFACTTLTRWARDRPSCNELISRKRSRWSST